MSAFRKRTIIGAVVAAMALSPVLPTPPVNAASPTKVFTVKATVKGAAGKTLVLMAKSGRVLASSKITGASKAVTMKTPKIKALTGASLHLIGSGGDYYGPVVLSWTGSKSAKATRVSTTMTSASTTASLGIITVKAKTANQGAGIVAKKFSKSSSPTTRAVGGVPAGVGSYGKNTVAGVSTKGVRAMEVNFDSKNVSPGADADFDGIANVFDVNDDGDTKLDFQDVENKPQPSSADLAVDCAANISFAMFSNFKATQPNFSGTINAYGGSVGSTNASGAAIRTALSGTLSFAIQRVSGNVCGEPVAKNEFKGLNVAYAPADWVTLPTGGADVQWTVGNGRMNNLDVAGLSAFDFTDTAKCAPGCISGQDTFVQRVTTTSGKTYEFVVTPGFIFITHPMLKSVEVSDTSDAAEGELVYSVSNPYGSQSTPVTVLDSSVVTIQIFRPQRFAIEGEPGDYYDIGGLEYYPDIPNGIGGGQGPGRCDAMKSTDTAMTTDTAINAASPPVMTLTWNVSQVKTCFESRSKTWNSGALDIDIQVVAPVQNSGNAAQKIFFSVSVGVG